MWRAWLLVLALVAGSQQLSITELSVPAAVEVGEDAEFHCKYDLLETETDRALYIKWWWIPLNGSSDQRSLLYQRIGETTAALHKNIEMYEVDGIRLLNASTKDSGFYECEVSNIDEVRKHQKMVVFSMGSGPLLNVSLAEDGPDEDEEDDVVVTCEAYDVAPFPEITISLNGQVVNSSGHVTDSSDGLYDVHENATFSVDVAEGGDFRCEIFYKDEDAVHAPYVASQTFYGPTASTTEESADTATATETSSDTSPTSDNGSEKYSATWTSLTIATLSLYYIAGN